MSLPNKALIYNKVPTGLPVAGQDLIVKERSFDIDQQPPDGGATVRQLYVSLDPYMRGRMRDPAIKSYNMPYEFGEPITAFCLVQIIKSDHPEYQAGDLVFSLLAVEEYTIATKKDLDGDQTYKIDNKHNLPLSNFVGILGMPGITAYASLYEIGAPKKGETIFVSSAAGAVGQVVGQLAKHEGLRVIGSVGDDEKLKFITEDLGFDGGFNYKKEKPADALARLAPDGIDIYYENVGGEQLEAALDAMNFFGRIGMFEPIIEVTWDLNISTDHYSRLRHGISVQSGAGREIRNQESWPGCLKAHQNAGIYPRRPQYATQILQRARREGVGGKSKLDQSR
jgi:NADPH-dependent curcumin reductase CurA